MEIKEKKSLKRFNTFAIDVWAKYFTEINHIDELQEIYADRKFENEPKLLIGGGSNVLFTQDFSGLVIKNRLKGIDVIKEDGDFIYLKCGAGEVWHDVVMFCVENGFGGIENLSLIPGCCGAAPIQNIGAYGVEIKDVLEDVEVYMIHERVTHVFKNADCQFGYRESIFKKHLKHKSVVLSITLKLSKRHYLNTGYGQIETELNNRGIKEPTIKDISDVVISIRQSKLPDPSKIGNAGSFFKNPVVSKGIFEQLGVQYGGIPGYQVADNVKVPAGWLIEKAGWKGKNFGNYGVHKNQALVLVNHGGAKGNDIFELSEKIIEDIKAKFGIELEREVNCV